MLMKAKLDKAIGMALGHDVIKIVPGEFKGPAFRRGHIIRKEDIPELLNIGKEHIYIFGSMCFVLWAYAIMARSSFTVTRDA